MGLTVDVETRRRAQACATGAPMHAYLEDATHRFHARVRFGGNIGSPVAFQPAGHGVARPPSTQWCRGVLVGHGRRRTRAVPAAVRCIERIKSACRATTART